MKRIILIVTLLTTCSTLEAQTISPEERTKSLNLLLNSQYRLNRVISDLSEEQVHFRPADNRWSIYENIEHLVKAENLVLSIIDQCLQISGEGQQRDMADDEFIELLSTRGEKRFTAPEKLQPVIRNEATFSETMVAFNAVRSRSLSFIDTSQQDLRHHFSKSPIGNLDAYQWTLQIAAHTLRHLEQIEEIIKSDGFPSK